MSRTGSSAWRYTRVASMTDTPGYGCSLPAHVSMYASSLEADRLLERTCARLGALPVGDGFRGRLGKPRVVKRKDGSDEGHKEQVEKIVVDVERELQDLENQEKGYETKLEEAFTNLRDYRATLTVGNGLKDIIEKFEVFLENDLDLSGLKGVIDQYVAEISEKHEEVKEDLQDVVAEVAKVQPPDSDIWRETAKRLRQARKERQGGSGGGPVASSKASDAVGDDSADESDGNNVSRIVENPKPKTK